MPYEPMSREEGETLATIEKEINQDLKWEARGNNMTLTADVIAIDGTKLKMHAVFHKNFQESYRFSLVFRSEQVIKRWDVGDHHNPDCINIDGPHKHYWTREARDSFAYPTADIPLNDVNSALLAFMRECNIKLNGDYSQVLPLSATPPKQRQMTGPELEEFDAKV